MRRNGFGEAYCRSAAEARQIIEDSENGWEVYQGELFPPEGATKASGEIRENASGDVVCYIEADTIDAVKAIIHELRLEG